MTKKRKWIGASMNPDDRVRIEFAPTATEDVRALVDELETFLAAEYAPEQRHGLALDALFQPHIRFFLAWLRGEAVGCGGMALFDDFAEVKRMYVLDAAPLSSPRRLGMPENLGGRRARPPC
jgi:putative acetyltransferase